MEWNEYHKQFDNEYYNFGVIIDLYFKYLKKNLCNWIEFEFQSFAKFKKGKIQVNNITF